MIIFKHKNGLYSFHGTTYSVDGFAKIRFLKQRNGF